MTEPSSPQPAGGLFAAAARSASWMVGAGIAARGLGFISTAIVARLLTPADYGLVALAMSVWLIFESLFAFGVESYLIKEKNPRRELYDAAFTLNLIRGAVFVIGLILAAPALAGFLGDERLQPVFFAVAFIAALHCARNIGFVNYAKELRFSYDFGADVSAKIVGIVVTIAVAIATRSYWALLAGLAATELWRCAYTYLFHPFRPRLALSGWRELFGFAGWLTLGRTAFALSVKFDAILIQRALGADAVGLFSVGRNLAATPTTEIIYPINKALFPAMSKAGDDRLKESHLEAMALITAVAAPAGLAVVVAAEAFVRALLGAQWMAAVPIVQMVGAGFAVLTVSTNFDAVLMTRGAMRLYFWRSLIFGALRIGLFLGGLLAGGLNGAAAGFALGCVLQMLIDGEIMNRLVGASWGEVARRIWRSALAICVAAPAALAVAALFGAPDGGLQALVQLIALGFTCGGVYAAAHFFAWSAAGRPAGPETRLLALLNPFFSIILATYKQFFSKR